MTTLLFIVTRPALAYMTVTAACGYFCLPINCNRTSSACSNSRKIGALNLSILTDSSLLEKEKAVPVVEPVVVAAVAVVCNAANRRLRDSSGSVIPKEANAVMISKAAAPAGHRAKSKEQRAKGKGWGRG